jgi:CheY-like chemotaxis protein
MSGKHYAAFVEEAFVRPIRSVLIVDDDYPTFDELLDAELLRREGKEPDRLKAWYAQPERIKKVIGSFRTKDRPLVVDIHDGSNVTSGEDVQLAAHLHQSDLLVLDYQLDRNKKNDGTLAIEIIRSLSRNDHFNMVVVHTSESLDIVFRETLLALMAPKGDCLQDAERDEAAGLIFDAETADEGFEARLDASIGETQYIRARQVPRFGAEALKAVEPFALFAQLARNAGWRGDKTMLVLNFLLERFEAKIAAKMDAASVQSLVWNSGDTKFIRADTVFIAFSGKNDDDDLIGELQAALECWDPQPSRLFLAKLRAEMDETGVKAQRPALENRHALARWYHRLLEADGANRKWMVAESVARHSEQLMSGILPQVQDFAARLVLAEAGSGTPEELSLHHFRVDLSNEAERRKSQLEHNAYVSSKPPEGWHLTTGQVFRLDGDYWVCVSPACDMVPDQLPAEKRDRLGDRLPFVAVKLIALPPNREIDASTNRFLFLKWEGAVKVFAFSDPSREGSSPSWYAMYAERLGVFEDDQRFTFSALVPAIEAGALIQRPFEGQVVAQLRYEYALNLVQRLGGSQTRIGLDFV